MTGINRFITVKASIVAKGKPPSVVYLRNCVFVSHKREDSNMARDIADVLRDFDVDVWLDLDELDATEPTTDEEHLKLTHSIEQGLANSTHLLALITAKTKGSWWVPFEIGSCRARSKELAFLFHKDVRDLPSYLKLGHSIIDKHDFLSWAEKLSRKSETMEAKAAAALTKDSRLDPYLNMFDIRR